MAWSAPGARGHGTFEHTADVGIDAWGPGLEALFEEAAAALMDAILDTGSVEETDTLTVSAEGKEPEELLVEWLEEVLYAFEVREFATGRARVDSLEDKRVEGTLFGEPFDPERHPTSSAVKAVTYHDLRIEQEDGQRRARIVLDV
jgi:SHS2 domain-containing protein